MGDLRNECCEPEDRCCRSTCCNDNCCNEGGSNLILLIAVVVILCLFCGNDSKGGLFGGLF